MLQWFHATTDDGLDAKQLAITAVKDRYADRTELLGRPRRHTWKSTFRSIRKDCKRSGAWSPEVAAELEEYCKKKYAAKHWTYTFILYSKDTLRLISVDVDCESGKTRLYSVSEEHNQGA